MGILTGAKRSQVQGDRGERRSHHSQSKGAQNRPVPRPFLLPEAPTARKEKISNGDNKIAAWLGRDGHRLSTQAKAEDGKSGTRATSWPPGWSTPSQEQSRR